MKELEISMPEIPYYMTEALNQLRVNLGFCGDNIKKIMLTSSLPNEGKSFVSLHLWKMMAEVGNRVLLIDCDFRNSEMRAKYSMKTNDEKMVGGAFYLAGQAELQDCFYSTNVKNGYIIPVTTSIANPQILLEGVRFKTLLESVSERFDYVLIDTPPLASVADAQNIAPKCDGSVLVIRSGATSRKLVQNSVQQLERTGIPLLGVVLNRVKMDSASNPYYHKYYGGGPYSRYSYGYRYGSYGDNEADNKKKKSK